MIWNLIGTILKFSMYGDGAAVCRLCYYRKPDPLPETGDVEAQGAFWKKHYNTPLGQGTVPKYVLKITNTLKEDRS